VFTALPLITTENAMVMQRIGTTLALVVFLLLLLYLVYSGYDFTLIDGLYGCMFLGGYALLLGKTRHAAKE